jgi:hypothetical protein
VYRAKRRLSEGLNVESCAGVSVLTPAPALASVE